MQTQLYENLTLNTQQHDTTMIFTAIAFLTYPFRFISQKYLFYKTKKQSPKWNVNDMIEIVLTVCIALWIYSRIMFSVDDSSNQFMDKDPKYYSSNQRFVFNVIWTFEIDTLQDELY